MAITQMAKVIIVSHRSQASQLLEALQKNSICQILNAKEAIVGKDWPELITEAKHPRDIEQLLNRLQKSITFLKNYAETPKGLVSVLAPRTVIDQQAYNNVVSDVQILRIVDQCEQIETSIEKLGTEIENLSGILQTLQPWSALQTPVEEICLLQKTKALTGLLPQAQLEPIQQQIAQLGAAVQIIGQTDSKSACLIICLNENLNEVQKLLRSAEFEPVNLESVTGTVAESIKHHCEKLNQTKNQLQSQYEKAEALAENLLKLQILHDHYENLLNREQTKDNAPATEQTVLLEGWVKQKDYLQLEKIVAQFTASSLSKIEPAEDEEIPVEIENKNYIRPFEVITRLYGMPAPSNLDPTPFLAPFFALFFGICLTDVGYGLLLALILWMIMRYFQGNKKAFWMLIICSLTAVAAGVITGSWFSDAMQTVLTEGTPVYTFLNSIRNRLMLFDPMKEPMVFFIISLVLGYAQVQFGLLISLFHSISQKRYHDAVFNHLAWIIFLNSLALYILSKQGYLFESSSGVLLVFVLVAAIVTLLLSHRQGRWGARLGMGAFQLFSTVFYFGDVLSYVRLMALGMVTGGLGIAANILIKLVMEKGTVGYLVGAVLFVIAHLFNLAIATLSAFVHTLRLQYVEFFPKFFEGGGRMFRPLQIDNKYVYIED